MTNSSAASRAAPVEIVDCSLTAGQQALWDGAMSNEMLLPILPRLDGARLKAIEILDPFVFQSCATRLAEDPWERVRLAVKRLVHTPASVSLAGRYLFGRAPAGRETLQRALRLLSRAGITRIDCYDPLNDVLTLEALVQDAKAMGMQVCGGVVFALGDRYDGAYFALKARQLANLGCDAVSLLDFSGIFHPESVPAVIPAMLDELRDVPLELRTHCRSSRAEIACFSSLQFGVAAIHAASEPLAGGVSLPSTDFFLEHLAREGYQSFLARDAVHDVRDYFEGISGSWGFPKGSPLLYDPAVDRHQVPAGLISRVKAAENGRAEGAVLTEITALRTECGDLPMAMPIAAWLLERAQENVRTGVRKPYQLSDACEIEDSAAPVELGEADKLTAGHIGEVAMREFLCEREHRDRSGWHISGDTAMQYLLGELQRRPWVKELRVENRHKRFSAIADPAAEVVE